MLLKKDVFILFQSVDIMKLFLPILISGVSLSAYGMQLPPSPPPTPRPGMVPSFQYFILEAFLYFHVCLCLCLY